MAQQYMDDTTRDILVNVVRSLLLARIRHGHAMTEYKEKLASVGEKKHSSVLKRVQELEAEVKKNKKIVSEASGALNRVRSEVDKKNADVEELKKSRDEAVSLAEGWASEMGKSRAELLDRMREAKALIDSVFSKGGMEASDDLPKADPKHLADWLSNEVWSVSASS